MNKMKTSIKFSKKVQKKLDKLNKKRKKTQDKLDVKQFGTGGNLVSMFNCCAKS